MHSNEKFVLFSLCEASLKKVFSDICSKDLELVLLIFLPKGGRELVINLIPLF